MKTVAENTVFFTVCAKNFLAYARVLYHSLEKVYENPKFFVAICDRLDGLVDLSKEPFPLIELDELGLEGKEEMAYIYNITEFNTSIKPYVIKYLFNKSYEKVIYLDPDILVLSPLVEVHDALDDGANCVLTPHILRPAEGVEIDDQKMLQLGIYNLGFCAFSNTEEVRSVIEWWARRLRYQCLIDVENGLFVDQKWADLIPGFLDNTTICRHPGYNVAYWNVLQRNVVFRDMWRSNDEPLRFVHFSGLSLDDGTRLSRHTGDATRERIGQLAELMDEYKRRIAKENHHYYRSLPYAFSWSGTSGVNLHTPERYDHSGQGGKARRAHRWARVFKFFRTRPRSWLPGRKKKAVGPCGEVSTRPALNLQRYQTLQEKAKGNRVLYIDWKIPQPTEDAGSVTAVNLLSIFVGLGFEVDFLPLDRSPKGTQNVEVCGAKLVLADKDNRSYLAEIAGDYDFLFLCRGPVIGPVIDLLADKAPHAAIIFNTVDLHFLREQRRAELKRSKKMLRAALETKKTELKVVEKSDATIVLSTEELYLISDQEPEQPLAVVPLIFDDIKDAASPLGRSDIVFIGGFAHKPNVDAVLHFVEYVWPLVRKQRPELVFNIVGSHPTDVILALDGKENIVVHGLIENLDDVFLHARLSVAPLRFGAGIKGKIGTSLCYGVPVVATTIAVEGMRLGRSDGVAVADSPSDYAELIGSLLDDDALWQRMSDGGLAFVREHYSLDRAARTFSALFGSLADGYPAMHYRFDIPDWHVYSSHRAKMEHEYQRRYEMEKALLPADESAFSVDGFCAVCKKPSTFTTSFLYAHERCDDGRNMPNWREHLSCSCCGFVTRTRGALHFINTVLRPGGEDRIYLTEQVTDLYRHLSARHSRLVGSEYYGPGFEPGAEVDGVRHEDIQNLSFADDQFSLVLSFDVLEHVPDHLAALREMFRCLAPGGTLLFTVPFSADSQVNVVRAELTPEGELVHHMEPEYHGNPVDPEGALCFRYFGWEVLDEMRRVGFTQVRVVAYWSRDFAYLGKEQLLIAGVKASEQ